MEGDLSRDLEELGQAVALAFQRLDQALEAAYEFFQVLALACGQVTATSVSSQVLPDVYREPPEELTGETSASDLEQVPDLSRSAFLSSYSVTPYLVPHVTTAQATQIRPERLQLG